MKLGNPLRAFLASRPRLWRMYSRALRRLKNHYDGVGPVHRLLSTLADEAGALHFVQVGSNDASLGDPIIDLVLGYGWRGVMIEPVPNVFQRLRGLHGSNPRLQFENVAIAGEDGVRTFYSLEPLDAPPSPWYDQMGSFSREHIVKHERFTPGLTQHIRETPVQCLTLTSLFTRHGIHDLDLLHVDAEGYDFEVLKSLDYARCSPRVLLFEHGHLSKADCSACLDFLRQGGYRHLHEGRDTLAMHRDALRRWPDTARLFDALAPDF